MQVFLPPAVKILNCTKQTSQYMPRSTASQASYYSTPSQYTKPVGRKELLKWSSEISEMRCNRLEDLRDGVVILRIMSKIWPNVVDLEQIKWKVCVRWGYVTRILPRLRFFPPKKFNVSIPMHISNSRIPRETMMSTATGTQFGHV